MNLEDDKTQRELLDLARQNNALLKKLNRALVWGRVWRAAYWLVIIGVAIGSFYFLEPYLEQLKDLYSGLMNAQGQFQNLFE